MFDPARLVFIDETSTNAAMVRLPGRCRRRLRFGDTSAVAMLSSANSRAHSASDSSHELRIDPLQLATQVARTASSRTSAHR